MAKITEDYVSFKIAELLKEKGFEEECVYFYDWDEEDEIYRICSNGGSCNSKEYPTYYSMPTLQMAMKWLREVHNIGIFPSTYTHIADRKTIHSYGTAIINLKTYKLMTDSYLSNDTYEQACEAAIKYCLENLI